MTPDRESVPVRSAPPRQPAWKVRKPPLQSGRCEPGTVRDPGHGLPDVTEVLVENA